VLYASVVSPQFACSFVYDVLLIHCCVPHARAWLYLVLKATRGLGYMMKTILNTVHARTDTKKIVKKITQSRGLVRLFRVFIQHGCGPAQSLKWNTGPSSLHLWNWDVPVLFMQKMECSLQQSGGQPRSQVAETWVAISYLTTHACGTVYRTVSSSHVALSNHKPLLTLVCLGGLFSISRENKRTIGRPKVN